MKRKQTPLHFDPFNQPFCANGSNHPAPFYLPYFNITAAEILKERTYLGEMLAWTLPPSTDNSKSYYVYNGLCANDVSQVKSLLVEQLNHARKNGVC